MRSKMSWHLYSLTFKLESPLHVGAHKVLHLFRTRHFVPARPLWGALTAMLTRYLDSTNYNKVGTFLRKAARFSYFYLSDENEIFIPRYTDDGLKFGNFSQIEFEKRFMSSMASTAIESNSFTAEEGMLHDVEFISPHQIHVDKDAPKPVFLKGLLWISERSDDSLEIQIDENDVLITNGEKSVTFSGLAMNLQVGGERKYGFGKMMLHEMTEVKGKNLDDVGFKGMWEEKNGEIQLKISKNDFIWSHVKCDQRLNIKGCLEPVIGRDWGNKGAGRELKSYGLCWMPGSILLDARTFKITENFGLWEMINETS